MPMLLISEAQREQIAAVIAYAKAHPIPVELVQAGTLPDATTIELKDRRPGFVHPPTASVMFPGGYLAHYSVEQQPFGFCSHLSISVEGRAKKGMLPGPEAVIMIAQEFGVPFPPGKMWQEEYEPGEYAVNLVSLYEPAVEGHA